MRLAEIKKEMAGSIEAFAVAPPMENPKGMPRVSAALIRPVLRVRFRFEEMSVTWLNAAILNVTSVPHVDFGMAERYMIVYPSQFSKYLHVKRVIAWTMKPMQGTINANFLP